MAREAVGYRDILASLLEYFNGRHWVYPTEVAGYLGMDYRTAMRKFGLTRKGCAIETLARRLCDG